MVFFSGERPYQRDTYSVTLLHMTCQIILSPTYPSLFSCIVSVILVRGWLSDMLSLLVLTRWPYRGRVPALLDQIDCFSIPFSSIVRALSHTVTISYGLDTRNITLQFDLVATLSISDTTTARHILFT